MRDASLQFSTGLPDEQMHLRENYLPFLITLRAEILQKLNNSGWEGGKAMNSLKNDFLAKDEDDEGDTCYQTCTFIGHRVCNPSFQFPFDDDPW